MVANISAWNYPYFVGSNVFVPALLAGNAVLYKPSEFATLSGRHIAADAARGGSSGRRVHRGDRVEGDGCGASAPADRRRVLHRLLRHRSEDRRHRRTQMIKVQLELGGKDPVYVCEDVDVKWPPRASPMARSTTPGSPAARSSASTCTTTIHDAFVAAFLAEVKAYSVGDPMDEATYIGPITRRAPARGAATAGRRRQAQGRESSPVGGNVIRRKGNWFAPTVFVDVDHSMALMREESFGPIIGIQKVRNDAEAVELMNDTPVRLDRRGLHARREARASPARPGQRRHRRTGTAATASARACPGPASATPASVSRCRPTASRLSRGPRPGICALCRTRRTVCDR